MYTVLVCGGSGTKLFPASIQEVMPSNPVNCWGDMSQGLRGKNSDTSDLPGTLRSRYCGKMYAVMKLVQESNLFS